MPPVHQRGRWSHPKLHFNVILMSFVLILHLTNPVLTVETPDDDALIREAILSLNLKNASCVVFAGENDAAINELKKFLRHDETLTVEKVNNKFQLRANEEKTLVPKVSVDLESRSRLFTLTDDKQDLPAQLFNKRVLETAGGLKVVVVESFAKLLGDNYYETLTKAVKNVISILGERVQWYSASVGLVATKVDRSNLNDTEVISEIKYKVNEFVKYRVKQREEALENNDMELVAELDGYITVGKFLVQKKAFGILRSPNAKKSPWELPPLKKNYNQLRRLIFDKLEFSPSIGSDAEIVAEAETRNEIREKFLPGAETRMNDTLLIFAARLEQALYGKLFNQFDDYWQKFFAAALDRLNSFEHLKSLEKLIDVPSKPGEDIASVAYLIEFYCGIVNESFHEYKDRKITWVKRKFQRIFSDAINNHEFLASLSYDFDTHQVQEHLINDQTAMLHGLSVENFKVWQRGLIELGFSQNTTLLATKGNDILVKKVEALAKSVLSLEVTNTTSKVLIYSGHYVFLSEVKNAIVDNMPTEVEIVAMRKLFVDCDLELKDTHLTIYAPVLEVTANTKFTLSGSDAEPAANTPGTNGNPGYSSGQFYLVVQEVINPTLLFVDSYGGNGSDGIVGSAGADNLDDDFDCTASFEGLEVDVEPRVNAINSNLASEGYHAWWNKFGCNWFGLNCDYTVWVTKNEALEPNKAGNGGNAGPGALAGKIFGGRRAQVLARSGKNGNPGKGGKGGSVIKMERIFDCWMNPWNPRQDCFKKEYKEEIVKADDGVEGSSPTSHSIKYYHEKQRALFDALLHITLRAVYFHSPINQDEQILELAAFEEVTREFTTVHFFKFLGAVQDAFVDIKHTANLKNVVRSFYTIFSTYKDLSIETESSYLDLIELMFVDTLSKCDSFSRGRQVVKLGDKITNEIRRLDEVKDIQQDLFVYETVKKEGEEAAKEIKEAEDYLQEFYDSEMVEIEEGVNSELDELVTNVYAEKEEYYQNIAELEKARKEFQRAMRRKVISKIFGTALNIAGAWFPIAGVAGSAVIGLGNSGPNGDVNIEELMPDITHAADNAASVIVEYWLEREVDLRSKQEAQLKASQLFLNDTSIALQVLSEQEYTDASNVVNESSYLEDVEDERWGEFYKTFDEVEKKIASARGTTGNDDDEVKLNVFETVFEASKAGFLFAKDVLSFVSDIKAANARLEQFDAAIDANKVAIEQLDAYRKMIDDLFIPMLEDMRDRLDNMQTELEDAKSVVIGIKEFEMKKKISEFTDFVFRFTEGLLEEDDFAELSAQLQDVVSVLADGYEKIEEIGNRLEMKQFVGSIVGGDCNQAEDQETCYAYEAARAEVEKSHLLVSFIEIFAAYRRVIFPFGADKVKILGKLVENLRNDTLESQGSIKVVQAGLDLLKNDLDDMSTSITNMDRDIIYANFNPKYRTGRAFYTWPAGNEHRSQIEGLINGEVVSLVARADHEDARNAVKFKVVALNFTSTDPKVNTRVQDLLLSFRLEASHQGPSHYRCGSNSFVIGGDPLHFSVSYELDENGDPIEINEALSKLKNGDVPLSPYTVWRFQLKHIAFDDVELIRAELLTMAGLLDIELIGEGYYIKEESTICNDLNTAYEDIEQQF